MFFGKMYDYVKNFGTTSSTLDSSLSKKNHLERDDSGDPWSSNVYPDSSSSYQKTYQAATPYNTSSPYTPYTSAYTNSAGYSTGTNVTNLNYGKYPSGTYKTYRAPEKSLKIRNLLEESDPPSTVSPIPQDPKDLKDPLDSKKNRCTSDESWEQYKKMLPVWTQDFREMIETTLDKKGDHFVIHHSQMSSEVWDRIRTEYKAKGYDLYAKYVPNQDKTKCTCVIIVYPVSDQDYPQRLNLVFEELPKPFVLEKNKGG